MSNFWNIPGIPHRGWNLVDVIDVREDGQSEDETDYETCMMCGNERIRFVHILEHSEISDELRVGCICAEKMTSDYVNPKRMENDLRNKAARRSNWINKDWKFSKNGNQYLNKDGHLLLIYRDKKTKKYKGAIDKTWGKKAFDTLIQVKTALFNGIEYFKSRGEW
jgi:hypothetical protein